MMDSFLQLGWMRRTGSDPAQRGQHHVDQLDAHEGHQQAAQAIDQQVAAQQHGSAQGPVTHAFERQRDQHDDDQRVEDHG
ncbi:hypothetical protein G6F35_019120 [Rhizopus arrhizus]|nr:hypothetical protein G6F35_019120 [Rhizopus arrhizus]